MGIVYPRILVVEDSQLMRWRLVADLQTGGFAQVAEAADCASARRVLAEQSIDLLLVDYILPDGLGSELLATASQLAIPALIVTSMDDDAQLEACFAAGAADYIRKPWRPVELLARVKSQLARRQAEMEVRHARAEWEATFDSLPDLMAILDPEKRITRLNQAAIKGLGRAPEELIGRHCHEIFHYSGKAPGLCPFGATIKDRQPHFAEIYEEKLGGHFMISTSVVQDREQNITALVHIARDITERKRMEEALRESEQKFANAFKHSGIGIALVGLEGQCLEVNHALCEIVGYTADELRQKTFQDITHPEDLDADLQHVSQLLVGRIDTYQMEKRYFHKSGQIVWVVLTAALVRHNDGRPKFFISQVENITDRKRMEETLRESEQKFANAFKYSGIGMSLLKLDGTLVEVNDSLCRMLGYSREELSSLNVLTLTHPEDQAKEQALLMKLLASPGEVYQLEKRYLSKSGEVIWTFLTRTLVRNADGQPQFLVGQVEDISERKRMAEKLQYEALHDVLTGIFNRRAFMERLESEFSAAKRYGQIFTLCFCDLDNFKLVNDRHGHMSGDEVLKIFSEILVAGVRDSDLVGRLGGDEFALIFTHTSAHAAVISAERIRQTFATREISVPGGTLHCTTTLGLAEFTPGLSSVKDLIAAADLALYEAKAAGRNAVRIHNA